MPVLTKSFQQFNLIELVSSRLFKPVENSIEQAGDSAHVRTRKRRKETWRLGHPQRPKNLKPNEIINLEFAPAQRYIYCYYYTLTISVALLCL